MTTWMMQHAPWLAAVGKLTILLTAVIVGRGLLQRSPSSARYLLGLCGLAAALALPLLTGMLPAWDLQVLPAAPAAAGPVETGLPPVPRHVPGANTVEPVTPTAVPPTQLAVMSQEPAAPSRPEPRCLSPESGCGSSQAAIGAVPEPAGSGSFEPRSAGWIARHPLAALALLWAIGFLAVAARTIVGWLRVGSVALDAAPCDDARVLQMLDRAVDRIGVRCTPRVLISEAIRMPVLWGFLSPTLLLPRSARAWSGEQLEAVLLHELAHVRRRDGLGLLIGRLATAIYWFHPLAWWIDRGIRQDRELACDDAVVRSGLRASSYARQLLSMASSLPERRSAEAAALGLLRRNALEGRLRSILQPGLRRHLPFSGAAAVCAVVALLALPLSTARLAAREPGTAHEASFAADDSPGTGVAAQDVAQAGLAEQEDARAEFVAQASPRVLYAVRDQSRVEYVAQAEITANAQGILLAHDVQVTEAGARAWERAYELHRGEHWEAASEKFREAADAGYRTSTALYNAACGQARLGRTGEAIALIERAIEAGFDRYDLIYGDADLDPIRATGAFRAMLEQLDDSGRGRRSRVRADRYEVALEAYAELQDATDVEPGEWSKVGTRLLGLRQLDAAVDALGRAVEGYGDNGSTAMYNLACAHALNGSSREALEWLEKAVLAGFDSAERFENDTDIESVRGTSRFREIEQLMADLSLDEYRNGDGWWGGRSRISARRWEPAVVHFAEFTREHPAIGRGWHNYGWALHHSGQHAEAIDAFRRAYELGWRRSTSAYNVACASAMDGNEAKAMEWLERAADAGFANPGQMAHDEDLESLQGDRRFEDLLERLTEEHDQRHGHRLGLRKLRRLDDSIY